MVCAEDLISANSVLAACERRGKLEAIQAGH